MSNERDNSGSEDKIPGRKSEKRVKVTLRSQTR